MNEEKPTLTPEPAPDLNPKTCPRCGREAHFSYTNALSAKLRLPLCWGEGERDCPGFAEEGDGE